MPHGALDYHRSDERPPWRPVVRVNGVYEDMTTGFSFTVLIKDGFDPPVLTKTTDIVGSAAGVVTVNWALGDLDLEPGSYRLLLIASRDSDSAEWTVEDKLSIRAR